MTNFRQDGSQIFGFKGSVLKWHKKLRPSILYLTLIGQAKTSTEKKCDRHNNCVRLELSVPHIGHPGVTETTLR